MISKVRLVTVLVLTENLIVDQPYSRFTLFAWFHQTLVFCTFFFSSSSHWSTMQGKGHVWLRFRPSFRLGLI
ncbi:hypothetical protein CIPAW_16G114300 [Carya illinoinensis]|uniref:Uncharacterized protein n=1 Tax=Carya illinoinensis TaxID=32201 RepID=A0A8T1N851_CARIL|nr:hypothetical protein CIPAW_16G114300 [Carya illinoinensis]